MLTFIADILSDDDYIRDNIGTFNFGSGVRPAVFDHGTPPKGSHTRFITMSSISTGRSPGETRGIVGNRVDFQVVVTGKKQDSTYELNRLGLKVFGLVHKARPVGGVDFCVEACFANAPVAMDNGDGYPQVRIDGYFLFVVN